MLRQDLQRLSSFPTPGRIWSSCPWDVTVYDYQSVFSRS